MHLPARLTTLLCCLAPLFTPTSATTNHHQHPLTAPESLALMTTTPTATFDPANLRLLTQNCKLLILVGEWPVMGMTAATRARFLADRFLARNLDIIGLNEIFLKEPTRILKTAFEENGYHVVSSLPERTDSIFRINSGLMLASRLPILDHFFEAYPPGTGMDWFSMKGILVAELDTGKDSTTGRLFVAISHHQSEGADELMVSQFRLAAGVIENFVLGRVAGDMEAMKKATVLYFGDMNVDEAGMPGVYKGMMESLSKETHDLFKETNAADVDGRTFPVENPVERLDFFFSLKEFAGMPGVALGGSTVSSVVVDRLVLEETSSALSDHLGLVATVHLV
ncbi:hypothetical protein HDU98_011676 [Podochytrium sp. JEL0797]|nr:hypothetical protein HDU98_011676 [Podochytrium sp. JEL0797]